MDRRVRARVSPGSRSQVLAEMVDALAPLEPELVEADWPAIVGTIRARVNQRALVVLLTAADPAVVEEGLLPVLSTLTSRHLVVLASVTDPELAALAAGRGDGPTVHAAAAAERAALERAATAGELGRLGVQLVEGDPEQLPPRLADTYLALKAAGRL